MARYGIGNSKIVLRLLQNGKWYEVACKDEITITREPNVASKLTTSIRRSEITAERGDIVHLILDDDHHQFQGMITSTQKSDIWCEITAYDQLYYLNKNKAYYSYENKRADELWIEIAKMTGLKMTDPPQVMTTKYTIPSRVENGVSYLEMMTTALDLTLKYTGERFFIWDDAGNLCMHSEEWLAAQTKVRISMGYIEDYSYSEDIEDLYTKVTIRSSNSSTAEGEGTSQNYVAEDKDLQARYGVIEYTASLGEYENGDFVAKHTLKEKSKETKKLTISGCQGDIVVRGGSPVYVDFFSDDFREFIRGWFRTDSVTHHLGKAHHTMDLTLSEIEMYDDWTVRGIGRKQPTLEELKKDE